jgi:hypothetical protein
LCLGFIVAIQVLMWISGRVVMSVLPIEKIRGKDLVMPNNVTLSEAISLNQWQSVSWFQRSNHWVIKAIDFEGHIRWLEPSSGKSLEYFIHK